MAAAAFATSMALLDLLDLLAAQTGDGKKC